MPLTPLRPAPERLLAEADVQSLASLGVTDPPTEPEVVVLPEDPASQLD
ncbi:hypothetical protein ACWENA_08125 [Streptomyces sp. NPDC004779]